MTRERLDKNAIAHAAEKKLVVFRGEQMYLRVNCEANADDVVMFVGEFVGSGSYLTAGKLYRVFTWCGSPAIYDDAKDIILVYEREQRTRDNVLVFRPGSIERVFAKGGGQVGVASEVSTC